MSGAEIMGAVAFGLLVFGAISGAFWRMWGLIKEAGGKGEKAQTDLAAYKTHVAETYTTKTGMQEQTAQLMKAIEGVGSRLDSRLDGVNERLDRLYEAPPRRT